MEKNEIPFFHEYILNIDISFPMRYKLFKFSTYIHEIWMQGTLSQNLYLGPTFDFIKCRNLNIKKLQKVTLFSHKIKTRTQIIILRLLSLIKNLKGKHRKFQFDNRDSS